MIALGLVPKAKEVASRSGNRDLPALGGIGFTLYGLDLYEHGLLVLFNFDCFSWFILDVLPCRAYLPYLISISCFVSFSPGFKQGRFDIDHKPKDSRRLGSGSEATFNARVSLTLLTGR